MHHAKRVILDSQPYLVKVLPGGGIDRAFGPLAPGTEPPLRLADEALPVEDPRTLAALAGLAVQSPWLADDPEVIVSETGAASTNGSCRAQRRRATSCRLEPGVDDRRCRAAGEARLG